MSCRKCLALLLPSLLSAPALAADDVIGAASLGVGGAITADPRNNDTITVNPGMLAHHPRYDIQAHGALWGTGYEFGGSVVDARQSIVAVGVSYRRLSYEAPLVAEDLPGWIGKGDEPTNRKRYHDIAVGAAVPFWDHRGSVGLSAAVALTNHDRRGDDVIGNVDLGVGLLPAEWMSVGLVARNLSPLHTRERWPTSIAGGVRFGLEELGSFAIDLDQRLVAGEGSSTSFAVGGSKRLELVDLRVGFRREGALKRSSVTWGFGINSEEGSLDYGMQIPVGEPLQLGNIVYMLGFRLRT